MLRREAFRLRMRRHWKVAAVVLSLVLGLAVLIPVAAGALTPNTPKQEVVYVKLRGDGSVDSIYVVNMFDLDESGQIVDYGDYTALRNLTSSDKLVFEDGKVTIDAPAGKLYYEGRLKSTVIPWRFEIHYFLNGQEYPAEEIAGKSGALRITMAVRQNPEGNRTFFDHYALQITFALDNRKTRNIVAEGATQAIVGGDRQVVFTILPGQEKDLEITADVTDFAMDGITISALTLDLGLAADIADSGDLKKLTDGIAKVDDGAQEVKDGAERLHNRAGDLTAGVQKLQAGIGQLREGAGGLAEGARQLVEGARRLDENAAKLLDGARELYDGTSELYTGASSVSSGAGNLSSALAALAAQNSDLIDGAYEVFKALTAQAETQLNAALQAAGLPTVTLTPENYDEVLTNLLDQFSLGAYSRSEARIEEQVRKAVEAEVRKQADAGLSAETVQQLVDLEVARRMASDEVRERVSQGVGLLVALNQSYKALVELKAKLDQYQAFYSGLVAYTNGVAAAAEGAAALSSGATSLTAGTGEVQEGARQLYDGMAELKEGTVSLLGGLVELQGGTLAMQDGVMQVEGGVVRLLNGALEFYDSTIELRDGAVRLADGTRELRSKTADLKDRIKEAIAKLLGGKFRPVSFASEKNTNVEFVQFVMKTPAIAVDAGAPATGEAEPAQRLTFWQKVLKLFGLLPEG